MDGPEMIRVACENCGANIDLDALSVATKKKLNKSVECAICRNARVAKDMDMLTQIFTGIYEEETDFSELRKRLKPSEPAGFF